MATKYTIEDMQNLARKKGGKCLSKKYVNGRSKLQWMCSKGHKWNAVPESVHRIGTWCPECSPSRRIKENNEELIEILKKQIQEIGIVPSQDEWRRRDFYPSINVIKRRFGCYSKALKKAGLTPNFFGQGAPGKYDEYELIIKLIDYSLYLNRVPKSIDLDRDAEVPGKNTYISHFGTFNNALYLAGLRDSPTYSDIKEAIAVSKEHKGKFLDFEYRGATKIHNWECIKGHKFKKSVRAIQGYKGREASWCIRCKFEDKIFDIKKAAKRMGGECLNNKYKGRKHKHLFRCAKGHEWEAVAGNIIDLQSWCPDCAGNKKLTIKEINRRFSPLVENAYQVMMNTSPLLAK